MHLEILLNSFSSEECVLLVHKHMLITASYLIFS